MPDIEFKLGSGDFGPRHSELDQFALDTLNKPFRDKRESALDKFNERTANREFQKENKEFVHRTVQKASDATMEAGAAFVAEVFRKVQPAWKVTPVEEAIQPKPQPFDWDSKVPANQDGPKSFLTPTVVPGYRLQVKDTTEGSTVQVSINAGTAGGMAADPSLDFFNDPPTPFAIPNSGLNIIYIVIPMSYAADGLWTASDPSIAIYTSEQTNDDSTFYIEITRVMRSGDVLTLMDPPAIKSDVWFSRWGAESGYADNYDDGTP